MRSAPVILDMSEQKRALLPMMRRARYHGGYSAVARDRAASRRDRR